MKTFILTIFISIVFLLNTKAQIKYHVYGSIDRKDIEKVYLVDPKNTIFFDSTTVKEGVFNMNGDIKAMLLYL